MSRLLFEKEYIVVIPTYENVEVHSHMMLHLFIANKKCILALENGVVSGKLILLESGVLHGKIANSKLFLLIDTTSSLAKAIRACYLKNSNFCIATNEKLCEDVAFLYSVFAVIKWNTIWMLLGFTVFLISAICFANALFCYAHTEADKPVTTGIYRYTRNPQQIFAATMWIGVGFMTTSYVIIILCVLQLILAYPTFRAQERFCLERYGHSYQEYMEHTRMYFGRK